MPLAANVPLQAFDAVHEVASVDFQVSVAEPPLGTPPVLVIRVAVGMAATALVAPATMEVRVNTAAVMSSEARNRI